jgi:hypothetical protein
MSSFTQRQKYLVFKNLFFIKGKLNFRKRKTAHEKPHKKEKKKKKNKEKKKKMKKMKEKKKKKKEKIGHVMGFWRGLAYSYAEGGW